MRLKIAAASLTLASALGVGALSAQRQNPPAPVPAQPGQPTQPGQQPPQPGQPTQPGQPRPGQPTQPGQGTAPSQPGAAARSQTGMDREVTLTGCLARDTSKPAAGGQATDAFLLTHARTATGAAGDARGSASGSQTTPAPAGAAGMGMQYRLMAKGDVNFAPHLNHQIRVTGTAMDTGAANRSATAGSTGSGAPPAPMFHVTQLTMVSATCDMK